MGLKFQCKECGKALEADVELTGQSLPCPNCKNMVPVPGIRIMPPEEKGTIIENIPQTQNNEINPIRYGGFWIRLLAGIIDTIILFVFLHIFNFVVIGITFVILGPEEFKGEEPTLLFKILFAFFYLINLLIIIAYEAIFVVKKGATLGKMVFGLRVINSDGEEKVSWGKAIGRSFAKMLNQLLLYIGFIMIAFTPKKRGLHDYMCNTLVIYKDKKRSN